MIRILIALILYLPTTIVADPSLYLLYIPLFLYYGRDELIGFFTDFRKAPFRTAYLKKVWLPLVLLILIGINLLIGNAEVKEIVKSPVFFLPLTFISAYMIADRKVMSYLIFFVAAEIMVGVAEYMVGVNSFFTWLPKYFEFINYDSMYHTRVFGLGYNSSNLAQKSLMALLLLYFIQLGFTRMAHIFLHIILIAGIFFSFGRTVLIVTLVLLVVCSLIYLIRKIVRRQLSEHENLIGLLSVSSLTLVLIFNAFLIKQFTRLDMIPRPLDDSLGADYLRMLGLEGIEMAGRRELWARGIEFFLDHPFLGNHSVRFLVNGSHLHNSFLEFLTTNGLVIFLVMLAFIIVNLNRRTWLLVGFICLYSMGQYGIFWNISFLDVLLIAILLFWKKFVGTENERYQ